MKLVHIFCFIHNNAVNACLFSHCVLSGLTHFMTLTPGSDCDVWNSGIQMSFPSEDNKIDMHVAVLE